MAYGVFVFFSFLFFVNRNGWNTTRFVSFFLSSSSPPTFEFETGKEVKMSVALVAAIALWHIQHDEIVQNAIAFNHTWIKLKKQNKPFSEFC